MRREGWIHRFFCLKREISWDSITIFARGYQHVSVAGLLQFCGHTALLLGAVISPCVMWVICVWEVLLESQAC